MNCPNCNRPMKAAGKVYGYSRQTSGMGYTVFTCVERWGGCDMQVEKNDGNGDVRIIRDGKEGG